MSNNVLAISKPVQLLYETLVEKRWSLCSDSSKKDDQPLVVNQLADIISGSSKLTKTQGYKVMNNPFCFQGSLQFSLFIPNINIDHLYILVTIFSSHYHNRHYFSISFNIKVCSIKRAIYLSIPIIYCLCMVCVNFLRTLFVRGFIFLATK